MAFESGPPPPDPEDFLRPSPPEPPRPRGWFVLLTVLVIVSLLGSSLAALFWMLGQRAAATAVAPEPVQVVEIEPSAAAEEPAEPDEPRAATAESALVTPPPAATADSPTAGSDGARVNRIVLVNADRQIETVAPDGSDRRILTEGRRVYQFPAWSPDGATIAAIGASASGSGIFLLDDTAGQDPSPLYFSSDSARAPFYLYWSPDSTRISFLANNPRDRIGLNLIEAADGAISRLIATGSPFYWNWTADASQMLIHSGSHAEDARLVMIDETGLDRTPQIDAPGLFQAPGISAGSLYWAYSQFRDGGNSWLVIADADNNAVYEERHAGPAALSWSPTRDQLAYISGSADDFTFWGPLRLLDVAGGASRLLSSDLVLAFFWSPDGRKIATISAPRINDMGGVDALLPDAGKARAASRGARQQGQFELSLSVFDVDSGAGLQVASFVPTPLFARQFLPFFDQYALSHSLWSPDSSALVLSVVDGRERKIMVAPAGGGRMREVGQGDIAFWSSR